MISLYIRNNIKSIVAMGSVFSSVNIYIQNGMDSKNSEMFVFYSTGSYDLNIFCGNTSYFINNFSFSDVRIYKEKSIRICLL